ncbi:MAG: phosphatidylglycerophosphate synthase, partial [Verrucomicrobiales bacterium]
FWTLPNALCVGRLVGSFALLPLALAGLDHWFVGVYLVLITTDLVDGPLARKLHQRSDLGAHLDSVADLALNACLLAGVAILCWDVLQHELVLIGALIASYCLSLLFGFLKFGRLISYHTYIAKSTQWLAMLAAVSLVLDWSVWPLRVAAVAAIVGNLEAIAITAVLGKWRSDVPALLRVWPGSGSGRE